VVGDLFRGFGEAFDGCLGRWLFGAWISTERLVGAFLVGRFGGAIVATTVAVVFGG